MHLVQKVRNVLRGLIQRHGTVSAKKQLWDREFSRGRWQCLEQLLDDSVFRCTEKYVHHGSILDLGCGPGTTAVELDRGAYGLYTGVDISEVAIRKAKEKIPQNGHASRIEYFQADIIDYVPTRQYDVILYGDSIYYIPQRQIAATLARYSGCLKNGGVFIVRIFDVTGKHRSIVEIIENSFEVVEKQLDKRSEAAVFVFRPLSRGRAMAAGKKH
jgi:SAM-dependent methyltransferase